MNKKTIVITGHFFGITACLGYFVEAAKRRDDLKVITAGSFHGNSMPWGTVTTVPDKYINNPDIRFQPMGIGDSFVPIEMMEMMLDGIKPDIWLQVDAGFHLEGKPKHGINCVYLTDPHVLRQIYDRTKPFYDCVFNPQTQYSHSDEFYLPYAADSLYNAPLDNIEKEYDICIIGNYYANRVELIEKLRGMGYKCFFQLGLAKDDAQLIMNKSKICINWSSMLDLTARCFEAMATGNVLLANRVPDLNALFVEDTDFVGFSTMEESVSKVKYIIDNWDVMKKIGDNGRKAIIDNGHWWDNRLETILRTGGLIS